MNAVIKRDNDVEAIGVAKLGEIFAASGYFRDVRDQAQAVVKILYGRELGFSPVVSMMGIHVIEGKPSLSSNLLGTLVKRSGKYDYRVKASTDKTCELEFFIIEGTKRESLGLASFSIEDAKTAGLLSKSGGGWTKYPKAMLFARALSAGIRLHCPDVSACPLYVPEELGATVDEEGAVTELPKSAKSAEVTTEDIEISGPAKPGGADDNGAGSLARAEPIAPSAQTADVSPLVKKLADITQAPAEKELGPPYVDKGQAANFERTFKDALQPRLRKDAKKHAHDWLKKQNIIHPMTKEPTAYAILRENFFEVREEAVAYAATFEG